MRAFGQQGAKRGVIDVRDFCLVLCDTCSIFVATKLTSSIKLQSGVLCLDLKST